MCARAARKVKTTNRDSARRPCADRHGVACGEDVSASPLKRRSCARGVDSPVSAVYDTESRSGARSTGRMARERGRPCSRPTPKAGPNHRVSLPGTCRIRCAQTRGATSSPTLTGAAVELGREVGMALLFRDDRRGLRLRQHPVHPTERIQPTEYALPPFQLGERAERGVREVPN